MTSQPRMKILVHDARGSSPHATIYKFPRECFFPLRFGNIQMHLDLHPAALGMQKVPKITQLLEITNGHFT